MKSIFKDMGNFPIAEKTSSKEMFKNLGYTYHETKEEIIYTNKNSYYGRSIIFNKIEKYILPTENDFYETSIGISLEELQAINKQVEELGWND